MPDNSGQSKSGRDMFPSHNAGKGDGDRSPGWRNNHPDINWGPKEPPVLLEEVLEGVNPEGQFVQVRPGLLKKVYR